MEELGKLIAGIGDEVPAQNLPMPCLPRVRLPIPLSGETSLPPLEVRGRKAAGKALVRGPRAPRLRSQLLLLHGR